MGQRACGGGRVLCYHVTQQINSKTRSRQRNQQYERSFVSYLLLLSFVIYLIGVGVLYLYFRPSSWAEWFVYLMPLIFFPIV